MRLRRKHGLRSILFTVFGFLSNYMVASLDPPKLRTFSPTIKYAPVGDRVTLSPEYSAEGNPPPVYRWRKRGSGYVSPEDPNNWHTINSVSESDFGVYHCVASNSFGGVIIAEIILTRARLELSGVNGAALQNLNASSKRGTFLDLRLSDIVNVDSQPPPTITWYEIKGGPVRAPEEITDATVRRAVSASGKSAALLDLKSEDQGRKIRVKFDNPITGVSKYSPDWNVEVLANYEEYVAPKIVIPPVYTVANIGKTTSFDCSANASPLSPLRYSWWKDGIQLSAGSKYDVNNDHGRLVIRRVEETDRGFYSCVVRMMDETSQPGRDRKEAQLVVHRLPRIVSSSIPNIFSEVFWGKTKVLRCEAEGFPSPSVTWFKDAEELPAVAWSHIAVAANQSLVVSGAGKTDEGVYQCVVRNDAGSASVVTVLQVKELKPNIFDIPKNASVVSGDSIVLQCPAEGAPPPTFSWTKAGSTIIDSNIDGSSGTLTIGKSTHADTGEYCCHATNQFGVAKKCIHVRVAARTVINEPPQNIDVIISTTARFRCGVSHDLNIPVTINWLFKGSAISYNSRRSKNKDGELKITSVSYGDAGEYTCVVTSTNGNDNRSASLRVIELPFAPTGVNARLSPTTSRNAIVSWIAPEDGNSPILNYLIQCQIIDLPDAVTTPSSSTSRSSLGNLVSEDAWKTLVVDAPPSTNFELERLAPSATYVFRVSAINKVGEGAYSSHSNAITIPQEAPSEPPLDFNAKSAATTAIQTEWKQPPKSGWNGVLRGYIIEYRLTGYTSLEWNRVNVSDPNTTFYRLTDLMVFRKYDVRIAAYNDRGIGVFSEKLTESTRQGTPSQPPGDVRVVVVNSTAIRVSWLPPPKSTINGVNQGYKIRIYNVDSPSFCPPGCDSLAHRAEKEVVVVPGVNLHEEVVSGLMMYTKYNVTVLCFTSSGDGVESAVTPVVTEQDLPGVVSAMTFTSVLDSSVTVEWATPKTPNGVITNYTVYHAERLEGGSFGEERSKILSFDIRALIISNLKSQTFYSVSITASTVVGEGPRETSLVESGVPPELPGACSNLAITEAEVTASTVRLHFNHGFNGKTSITKWIVEGSISEDEGGAGDWKVVFESTDSKIVDFIDVENLRPYTRYKLRIKKENIVGVSPPSIASRQFRTKQAAPDGAPENVILRAINATAIRVTWTPLSLVRWNGEPSGYRILYATKGSSNQSSIFVNDPNTNTVVLNDLDEWTVYGFSMAAYNTFGTSQYRNVGDERTMEAVPAGAPTGVRGSSINGSSTQLFVTWDRVPAGLENGDIQGYTVYYSFGRGQDVEDDFSSSVRVMGAETRATTLSNLMSFKKYSISISAFTRVGDGVRSEYVFARTGEDKPNPPSDVMFPDVGRDHAKIVWSEPNLPNGIITGYKVDCLLKQYVYTSAEPITSGTLSPTNRSHTFFNLTPEKYYTFSIKAKTQLGWGPAFQLDVFTRQNRRISDAPARPNVGRGQTEARSITINLNAVEGDAPTRYFTVQYQIYGEVGSGGAIARGKREARNIDRDSPYERVYPRFGSWRSNSFWSNWQVYEPNKILATRSGHVLKNLRPYTKYRFRVSATNDVGTSGFSLPSDEIVTKADTPGKPPVDVSVTPVKPTEVEVSFLDPPRSSWYGPSLLGYYVQYRTLSRPQWEEKVASVRGGILTPSSSRRRVRLDSLTIDERYEIKVGAYSGKGLGKESRVIIVDVGVAVPSAEPRSLSAFAFSSSELNVTWNSPPEEELNGNLLGYKLFYSDLETGKDAVRVSGYKNKYAILQNLRKYALYDLKILAYNSAGDGRNTSDKVQVRTLEDIPGIPGDVEFFNLTLNSLKLQWSPPPEANGIIRGFEIMYEEEEPLDGVSRSVRFQVEADRLEQDVNDLIYQARYNFSVRAKTDKGYGSFNWSTIKMGPQEGSPGPVKDLGHRTNSDALVLYWKYTQINRTVGFIIEKQSRDIAEENSQGRNKRSTSGDWSPWSREVMEHSKITGYKLKWGKLKQGSEYKFRVVAFNYRGPSLPTETKEAIRPLAMAAASAWWTEGWFKIVVALGGLIIVAILVATFIVVGRNNSRKEQAQMKRQGTMQRVEHVRPGMGHSNPVDVTDEMLDAGGGFATCDFDQRQSLRKSTKRGVNNNNARQNSYREPPLPTPAANYSEDDDEEDTTYSQGQRNKNEVQDDVTSKGEGDSGSSELTGKDIDDSLSADEDEDDLPLPPPPTQLDPQLSSSVTGFSTLPQNYSQYARNAPVSSSVSTSTNQISNPTSTFQSPTENPYSALHPAYNADRPPVHPNGRTAGLSQSQYLQQQHEPQYQRNSDYHDPRISHQPSGQTPRLSDSSRGPPPYGAPSSIAFTPPGSHYGGSQNSSQYAVSGGGRMTTSSPVPPPPPPPFSAPEDTSPSHLPGSVSPRGLASGAHFDSSSFVSHYSSANEVLANGGSLRRQPKRRPPSANNSHYGGGGSERGSDISLTEVGSSAGLFGARISHSPAGGGQHQPYYLSQSAAGSRAPLPGFSSFV